MRKQEHALSNWPSHQTDTGFEGQPHRGSLAFSVSRLACSAQFRRRKKNTDRDKAVLFIQFGEDLPERSCAELLRKQEWRRKNSRNNSMGAFVQSFAHKVGRLRHNPAGDDSLRWIVKICDRSFQSRFPRCYRGTAVHPARGCRLISPKFSNSQGVASIIDIERLVQNPGLDNGSQRLRDRPKVARNKQVSTLPKQQHVMFSRCPERHQGVHPPVRYDEQVAQAGSFARNVHFSAELSRVETVKIRVRATERQCLLKNLPRDFCSLCLLTNEHAPEIDVIKRTRDGLDRFKRNELPCFLH